MSSKEVEDRRQRALETYWDREPDGTMVAVGDAIETATRVQITPEIMRSAAKGYPVVEDIIKAAFAGAGFEVVE